MNKELLQLIAIGVMLVLQGLILAAGIMILGIDTRTELKKWFWIEPSKTDIKPGSFKETFAYVHRVKILSMQTYNIRITRFLYFICFPILLSYYILNTIGVMIGMMLGYIVYIASSWLFKPVWCNNVLHAIIIAVLAVFFLYRTLLVWINMYWHSIFIIYNIIY